MTWAGLLIGMWMKYGPMANVALVKVFGPLHARGLPALCGGDAVRGAAPALAVVGQCAGATGSHPAAGDAAIGIGGSSAVACLGLRAVR